MAVEQYGTAAQIVASAAQAGVDATTRVCFFGSAPHEGALNKIISVSSMAEARSKLGVEPGDGFSLTEACLAAFNIVGISQIYCVCVSNSSTYSSAWIGSADSETGIYTYEKELRNDPAVCAILCAPGVGDGDFLTALMGEAKHAEGFKAFVVYDVPFAADHIGSDGFPDADEISDDKASLVVDEYADAVWGSAQTVNGDLVSGAAIRACLLARSDADYNAPARVGGNLPVSGIVGLGYLSGTTVVPIDMRKSDADALSTNGICTILNRYGSFYSWGDHTSAFVNNTIADERGRFENTMRILMYLNNWFIRAFANYIDENMTPQMKEDILGVVQRKLDNLQALSALIGKPICQFLPSENPTDSLAQGHFVFSMDGTAPLPVKYLKAKVRYNQSGLSVYTQE